MSSNPEVFCKSTLNTITVAILEILVLRKSVYRKFSWLIVFCLKFSVSEALFNVTNAVDVNFS